MKQNQESTELMKQIWLELQKSREERAAQLQHGASCHCQKCITRRFSKGKAIPEHYQVPQMDGNDSDAECSGSPKASQESQCSHGEGPGISAQSQLSFRGKSNALEKGQSQISSNDLLSRNDRFARAGAFLSGHYQQNRLAKSSAKNTITKNIALFASKDDPKDRDYEHSSSESETEAYEEDRVEEDEKDVEENDASDAEEEFKSARSALTDDFQNSPNFYSVPVHRQRKRPVQAGNCQHCHPQKAKKVVELTDDEKCFVESFDLDLNSSRIDQFSAAATFEQCPENYFRFLSKNILQLIKKITLK